MSEVRTLVQAVRVSMGCDACPEGVMVPTGQVLTCLPPKYRHRCSECGAVAELDREYPALEWSEVPEVTPHRLPSQNEASDEVCRAMGLDPETLPMGVVGRVLPREWTRND